MASLGCQLPFRFHTSWVPSLTLNLTVYSLALLISFLLSVLVPCPRSNRVLRDLLVLECEAAAEVEGGTQPEVTGGQVKSGEIILHFYCHRTEVSEVGSMLSFHHGVGQASTRRPQPNDSNTNKRESTGCMDRIWIAYVMEWSGDGKLPKRVPLPTASELRSRVEATTCSVGEAGRSLFVFRGLEEDYYHAVLQASEVDSEFLAAHIKRLPYRGRRKRFTSRQGALDGNKNTANFGVFEYPEVVRRYSCTGGPDDMMPLPFTQRFALEQHPRHVEVEAVFCHASIWLAAGAACEFPLSGPKPAQQV